MSSQFFMPTKIILGSNCVLTSCPLLSALGKRALIVTGARSSRANGSLADILTALATNGQSYVIYDKVMSNPTVSCVYNGAAFARENGADFIIAIGGGSPMDAAKSIALLAKQDITKEDLFSGNFSGGALPMAFVPTTSGTGSEVTHYSILTNDDIESKSSIAAPALFPDLAFLDAKYTLGLPRAATVNTAVDALSHAVEGMLSKHANVVTDCLARRSIGMIYACMDGLKNNTLTPGQRETLLHASTLAGMVITNTGTTVVHAMGYSLTYFKNVDHGRANGLLLGAFLAFSESRIPERVRDILSAAGLSSVGEFKRDLSGLLEAAEPLTQAELEKYAALALKTKNIANCPVRVTAENIIGFYCESLS